MKLNDKQIAEYHAREMLGDEEWKTLKQAYDALMSFRKTN